MEEVLLECVQPGIKQGTKIYVIDLLCIFPLQFLSGLYFGIFFRFFSPEEKDFLVKWNF